MKKLKAFLLRTSVSILLLVFLLRKIDFKSTLSLMAAIDLKYLLVALSISLIIYGLIFYRWKMLLDAQTIQVPAKLIFRSFCGGIFFNLFLPSTIGGDVSRSLDLSAYTKRKSVVVASVLLDRLSGFVGLVVVAMVSLLCSHRLIEAPSVYIMVSLSSFLLAGILVVIFNQGIYKKLNRSPHKPGGFWDNFRKLHMELYFFRSKPLVLVRNIFYSIIIQSAAALVSYFLFLCVHVRFSLVYPLVFSPLVTIITTIPIGIAGLGLRDGSSIFFYTKVGAAKDAVLAQSLLNFILILFLGLVSGVIYVATFHYRRLQFNPPDAALK